MARPILRATEKVNCVNEEEELRKQGYILGKTLGEGSYAKVKAALSKNVYTKDHTNVKIALKIINKRKAPKDFLNKFLPRELEILKTVNHQNVIKLHDILYFNGKVFIAMELAGHGDLLDYVKLRGPIAEHSAKKMFSQLLSGIDYLHSLNIVHRDLKCENILLDMNDNIKVSDFGFARRLMADQLSKTFCGSAAYAAPEILQGIPYSGAAYDIWSCGVILYIIVCGSMPYDDSNIKRMIEYQTQRKVSFSKTIKASQDMKELIWIILDPNPLTRASISKIRLSRWMNMRGPNVSPAKCFAPIQSFQAPGQVAQLTPMCRALHASPPTPRTCPLSQVEEDRRTLPRRPCSPTPPRGMLTPVPDPAAPQRPARNGHPWNTATPQDDGYSGISPFAVFEQSAAAQPAEPSEEQQQLPARATNIFGGRFKKRPQPIRPCAPPHHVPPLDFKYTNSVRSNVASTRPGPVSNPTEANPHDDREARDAVREAIESHRNTAH